MFGYRRLAVLASNARSSMGTINRAVWRQDAVARFLTLYLVDGSRYTDRRESFISPCFLTDRNLTPVDDRFTVDLFTLRSRFASLSYFAKSHQVTGLPVGPVSRGDGTGSSWWWRRSSSIGGNGENRPPTVFWLIAGCLVVTVADWLSWRQENWRLVAACATQPTKLIPPPPPPPKGGASKERMAAIRALDVVADVAEEVSPAVVSLSSGQSLFKSVQSSGSGFIVDNAGHIVTNAHVVGHQGVIQVQMNNGRTFTARVLAIDSSSDLALVKLETDAKTAAQLPFLPLAAVHSVLRPGQMVMAFGSPLTLSNTLTMGIVSAVQRDLGHKSGLKYIQTDAIITFGNSGGPLVSLYGEVVGVNTMMAGTGVGFAIPVAHVHRFIEVAKRAVAESTAADKSDHRSSTRKLQQQTNVWSPSSRTSDRARVFGDRGEQQTRYLGATMSTLTPALLAELVKQQPALASSSQAGGVIVHSVNPGSPAANADLRPGDVILEMDGLPVASVYQVLTVIESKHCVSFTIFRAGRKLKLDNIVPEVL